MFVDADAVRLVQMVSNLIDNAVKYTPDAGHIDVAVIADGHEAVIVVQDDGAGIPFERVDSIFEPFVHCRSRAPPRAAVWAWGCPSFAAWRNFMAVRLT